MVSAASHSSPEDHTGPSWRGRIAAAVILVVAIVTVGVTNKLLTERYTEATRSQAGVRAAMVIRYITNEIERTEVMPLFFSNHPEVLNALREDDYTLTSQVLIEYADEIGAGSIMLLDTAGRVVAATQRTRIGEDHYASPFFVRARRESGTVFTDSGDGGGDERGLFWSRKIQDGGRTLGVVAVNIDLQQYEDRVSQFADAVMMTTSAGRVIFSTESQWHGRDRDEALEAMSPPSAIQRAVSGSGDLFTLPVDAYFRGEGVIRTEEIVPFQGWRMLLFTRYASVRERVNAVLALEITAFAILLAGVFYLSSRDASVRLRFFQRESRELRALNDRLSEEIAERERAQADLSAAEATLEQSSKLAVLGEMSASVSHELNQPLAAMKTYLAGARLLLQRRRHDEAMSSFQRIDDLIERMGAITRQLKSYARKGGEAMEPVDLRAAASSALAMMEPQLKARHIDITRTFPPDPVLVRADRLRIEQVIINLLRNALDATRGVEDPQLDLLLTAGRRATLTVRDNGHGIADLDSLFEPFYTTKSPGDGVGLGLAISSGIVADHGGRLTARNARAGGAVFEVQLPLLAGGGAPAGDARSGDASPVSGAEAAASRAAE